MNNQGPMTTIQLGPGMIYYSCHIAEKEDVIRLFKEAKKLIQQDKQKYKSKYKPK